MGKLVFDDAGRIKQVAADGKGYRGSQNSLGGGKERRGEQNQRQQPQAVKRKHTMSDERNQKKPKQSEAFDDKTSYRRALARMEMGPDDDMSDLTDLSDDGVDSDEDNAPAPGPGRLTHLKGKVQKQQSRRAAPDGYMLDGSDEEDGDDDEDAEMPSDIDGSEGGSQDEGGDPEPASDEDVGDDDGDDVDVDVDSPIGSQDGFDDEDDDDDDDDDAPREVANAARRRIPGNAAGSDDEGSDDDASDEDDGLGEGEDEEDGDEEGNEAMQQLAELPLGQRLTLLQDGSGPRGQVARAAAQAAKIQQQTFKKRTNKHQPREMSSKKPVSRFRQIVEPAAKPSRDPRFARISNDKEKEIAARRYAFLYDDVLAKEKNDLRQRLKNEKHAGAAAAVKAQLQRVEQALSREKQRRSQLDIEQRVRTKTKEAVSSGNKPYYLKDSDKKKLGLVAKYEELKSKGQLDRFMEKRRKRNASKDHRYIPAGRRENE